MAVFYTVNDMGTHPYFGYPLKIAGPCRRSVPAYRKQGIGLEMVRRVTMILKDEGYDLSYIHYTGVPHWYEKLGYRTVLRWTGTGVLPSEV